MKIFFYTQPIRASGPCLSLLLSLLIGCNMMMSQLLDRLHECNVLGKHSNTSHGFDFRPIWTLLCSFFSSRRREILPSEHKCKAHLSALQGDQMSLKVTSPERFAQLRNGKHDAYFSRSCGTNDLKLYYLFLITPQEAKYNFTCEHSSVVSKNQVQF